MSARYTVTLKNDSTQNGTFCVFQTIPMQNENKELFSLAWLTKYCPPGASAICYWDHQYSMMFGETGKLAPGVKFTPIAAVDADPADTDNNSIALRQNEYGLHFEKTSRKTPAGSLGIYCAENVRNNATSIGIGMGGMGVFAYTALANFDYIVAPKGKCWVAFGDYAQSEVLDIARVVPRAIEIAFPANADTLTVLYGVDNKLSVVW